MDDVRAPGLWIDGSCIRQPLRESAALQARRLEVVRSERLRPNDAGARFCAEASALGCERLAPELRHVGIASLPDRPAMTRGPGS